MTVQSETDNHTYKRLMTSNSGKHFLNDPSSLVVESLEGLCAVNPQLSLDAPSKGDQPIDFESKNST
jgi:hypothetical protein